MKIFTYEDPFSLTNANFWSEIKDAPHFCVSQTLVEGLIKKYGRNSFPLITTLDNALNIFYESWKDSPVNHLEQFLMVSDSIREIEDNKMKKSLLFNRREITEALRFLFEIDFDVEHVNLSLLSTEQQMIVSLYKKFKDQYPWNSLEDLFTQGIENLKDALSELLCKEIVDRSTPKLNEKTRPELLDTIENTPRLRFDVGSNGPKEQREIKQYYQSLLQKYDPEKLAVSKIVIHGVHQFSPLILQFIEHLNRMGVEVVFLINTSKQFPNIFDTWKRVYSWGEAKWHSDSQVFSRGNCASLGQAIGAIVEGGNPNFDPTMAYSALKFENLSSFAEAIAKEYVAAGGSLPRMNEQFYAVENNEINDLLKAYYPKQFKEKKFLSYPIGQFIIGLYKMWDHDENQLLIKDEALKECLAVNFFYKSGLQTPIAIYDKVALFIKPEVNVTDVIGRLNVLKENIEEIQNTSSLDSLHAFSFYDVKPEEVQYLIDVLQDLRSIAKQVIGDSKKDANINYSKHFSLLIQMLEERTSSNVVASEQEKMFLQELKNRLRSLEDSDITGSVLDLNETLYFYLQVAIPNDEGSNWMCRNLEQLDGAIFMNTNSNSKTLHLGMLSNEKMNVKVNDLLPWPLTEEFFLTSTSENSLVNAVLKSKKEYKNLLRYLLFYATYYSNNEFQLSFIENSEGKQETIYFLIDLLGLNASPWVDKEDEDRDKEMVFSGRPFEPKLPVKNHYSVEEQQDYMVCDYRYFQNHVVATSNHYNEELQIRFYYRNVLTERACAALEGRIASEQELLQAIQHERRNLEKFFPFWSYSDHYDLEQMAIQEVKRTLDGKKRVKPMADQQVYFDIKRRFLTGQVFTDQDKDINPELFKIGHNRRIEDIPSYFSNKKLHTSKVKSEICQRCKQRDLCLHYYRGTE